MDILLALVTLALGLGLSGALLWALLHLIVEDGYGTRPPRPPYDWSNGSSRPYAGLR